MTLLRAAWVVPVDQRPLPDGWVAVDRGRIVAVGHGPPPGDGTGPTRDLGRVALLPGLVNAHVHLELSWLRNRVPPAATFTSWVKQLIVARGRGPERTDDPAVIGAATEAAREAREAGTSAVGDISNSLASVAPVAVSGMRGLVFHELLGFKEANGDLVARTQEARSAAGRVDERVRVSVAPHAPYSVSPELFQAIRAEVSRSEIPFSSVHVGESAEEMDLLTDGTGEWAQLLRWIGAWRDDWKAPRTGPVEYLERLGVIDARTMVVHGVQLSDESLARVRALGATLVTCPRSNQWVGVGVPPVERFYLAGVPVAVGTDSLASVDDLNLFSELKTMRWLAPGVPAHRLIESGTLIGARALGLETDLGSLTPGKLAEIVAVSLPDEVADVEEYLVSGVDVRQVSWAHQA